MSVSASALLTCQQLKDFGRQLGLGTVHSLRNEWRHKAAAPTWCNPATFWMHPHSHSLSLLAMCMMFTPQSAMQLSLAGW